MVKSGKNAAIVMMTEKKMGRSTRPQHAGFVQAVASALLRRSRFVGIVMSKMTEYIFHHDHGPVDNDAEIDGADRQEISGLARRTVIITAEGALRNGCGDNQSANADFRERPTGSGISRRCKQQIVHHGSNRNGNQVAPIVEWKYLNALRSVRRCHLLDRSRTRTTTSIVRSSFCIRTMPVTVSVRSSRPDMPSAA